MSEIKREWIPIPWFEGTSLPNDIVLANIKDGAVRNLAVVKIAPPLDRMTRDMWTHYCPSSMLPSIPVPPKQDYCREAWDKLKPYEGIEDRVVSRLVVCGFGSYPVTFEQYQAIWNQAIAAARAHGVENV